MIEICKCSMFYFITCGSRKISIPTPGKVIPRKFQGGEGLKSLKLNWKFQQGGVGVGGDGGDGLKQNKKHP